ncbi:hypothetical protein [Ochrobactrum sp. CGA5]|uniref:hypothetical protein n=1 Tax=Ochrobactrum sp. CGA5 TaxID=2583453 RepID=UPI0011200037|nr:hypothetical protein [Ochrobactrum sp. CGA5]
MAGPLVVIVATDSVLRDSIVFLLASEKITGLAFSDLETAFSSNHAKAAICAIIDESVFKGGYATFTPRLAQFGKPIVFLTSVIGHVLPLPLVVPLTKPNMGRPLVDLVRAMVRDAPRSNT